MKEKLKYFDDIGKVKEKEVEIKNEDQNGDQNEKEIKIDENNLNINDDHNEYLDNKYVRRVAKSEIELHEKEKLVAVFKNLEDVLNKGENKPKTINAVYEMYLKNEFITKNHIKKHVGQFLLKFMFFFEGPIFGIIFLIGIFQMKSIMNALGNLIKDSIMSFYECNFKSNCNITNFDNSSYNFYKYYYNYTMNETIDFNLMLLTGFIGSSFLKCLGFKRTYLILFPFNIGSIIWLLNFNFNFKSPGIFDYDFVKLINLCFIALLLFIGIGGSALLSHQILIESHLKYKDYLIKKKKDEREPKDERKPEYDNELKEIYYNENNVKEQNNDKLEKKDNLINGEKTKLKYSKTILKDKNLRNLQKKQKLEDKLEKRENNKFDYFIMICLTTIIGYLGKYGINLLLDYCLIKIYNEDYDKSLFLFYIMILYGISIVFSMILYQLFKISIFEDEEKEEKKKKIISICQVCGYIIYTEKEKPDRPPKRNCCTLCCENIQNCCDNTFCNCFSICDICGCEPECSCKKCKYNIKDYNKKQEVFRYCYKTQRNCFWCNKFITNKIQKKNISIYVRIFYFIIDNNWI